MDEELCLYIKKLSNSSNNTLLKGTSEDFLWFLNNQKLNLTRNKASNLQESKNVVISFVNVNKKM